MNRGVLLGLVVMGSGFLLWYLNPTGDQLRVNRELQSDSSQTGTRPLGARDFGQTAGVTPREGGLAVMRAAKAPGYPDEYVEWGQTPERPAQSIGPDIDVDDLSIFESRATESIGPDVDVDDLSLLNTKAYEDIGDEVDVEDVKAYNASVFVESLGEDLDAETPSG